MLRKLLKRINWDRIGLTCACAWWIGCGGALAFVLLYFIWTVLALMPAWLYVTIGGLIIVGYFVSRALYPNGSPRRGRSTCDMGPM